MQNAPASRLTSKYQATIPAPVRKALGLRSGDAIFFLIRGKGKVTLRKQTPLDLEHARAVSATLEAEWLSKEDEKAYRDL